MEWSRVERTEIEQDAATSARMPLLVFADDWGRHPSSCQHLVRQLIGRQPVLWVNTIGTRPPRFDSMTVRRAWGKLGGWTRPAGRSGASLEPPDVVSPWMWPWFRTGFDRRLNRSLINRQLTPMLARQTGPLTAVTTIPIVADLIGTLPVDRWVYYCVDDFGQWPGLDREALIRMERTLVDAADVLIAASDALRDRLAGMGREAHLLTHGVDLEFWPGDAPTAAWPMLDQLRRPLVVFWGLIDRRLDVQILDRLGKDLTDGTIVLVGPEQDPDPALNHIPGVVRLPAVPYEQLPGLAREAAVLVMPYADLPVTRAMQPLKLKEYLATGRPVVVADLPANRAWADALDLADSPETFTAAVRRRIATGLPTSQRAARARLADEGWAAKAQSFHEWITGASSTRASI